MLGRKFNNVGLMGSWDLVRVEVTLSWRDGRVTDPPLPDLIVDSGFRRNDGWELCAPFVPRIGVRGRPRTFPPWFSVSLAGETLMRCVVL